MSTPVTIVGGNVAGLSSAYHLAGRGCPVRIYEGRVWDKPCGGAVSVEFARYLKHDVGLRLDAALQPVLPVRFGFTSGRHVDSPGFFIILNRRDLQGRLMEKLSRVPGVEIIPQRASLADIRRFSSQNVLAAGYGGFTRKIMGGRWKHLEYVRAVKYGGPAPCPLPERHLIVFDQRINGYGWVFIEPGNRFNIGMGGMTDRSALTQGFEKFIRHIDARFGYHIPLSDLKPAGWRIPMIVDIRDHPVFFRYQDKIFIGVGDALGLAHPVIAAGIEPAWLSGRLIGESFNRMTGSIDLDRYRRLLVQNLHLTCRKRSDLLAASVARSSWIPFKEEIAYLLLKLLWPRTLENLKTRPWFKPAYMPGLSEPDFS